jgi:asparagine synthase (glutamine-hydrolysing)
MCRIVGFWDFNYKGDYDLEEVIRNMRDTLILGGPDDAGIYIESDIGLALGHRRLSIIDLSPLGHQPMTNEEGDLVITYNGEVYNFQEIREELESEGFQFKSSSDTEVVLKSFERWGINALKKFRGMFAFAIWNRKEKELFLCRDRMGVKPLYWYYKDGLFMFSSELKAFHQHPKFNKEVDENAFYLFLSYGYIPSPFSIFTYAHKLEPSSSLVINAKGEVKQYRYWEIEGYFLRGAEERAKWLKRSEEELAEELENILTESFKLRLIADVPVGVFLSGGIDSSTVCALLAKEGIKLRTFTIGFYEKDYNEANYAKQVANILGTDHNELYCTPKEAFTIIPQLPYLYDEPFGDSSAIPACLVSQFAKSQVKVALSADGGDEQFCGYPRYWIAKDRASKLLKFPFVFLFSKVLDLLNPDLAVKLLNVLKFTSPKLVGLREKCIKVRNLLKAKDSLSQYELTLRYFLDEEIETLASFNFREGLSNLKLSTNFAKSLDEFSLMMLLDLKTYLPDDLLVKVDRASMGTALECREPFLDHKILEWTSQLPSQFKLRNGKSKHLLKKILFKYLPSYLFERPKHGFNIPIYEWFRKSLKELYMEYLNENRIKEGGFFNPIAVKNLLEAYLRGITLKSDKLWLLFLFEQWREKWRV